MKRFRVFVLDMLLLACSIALTAGVKLVFGPCGHADAACRWAGNAVFGLGLVLCVQSLIEFFTISRRVKIGVSLAMVPAAILAALCTVDGLFFPLCTPAAGMQCRSLMMPAVIAVSAVIAALGIASAVTNQIHVDRRSHGG